MPDDYDYDVEHCSGCGSVCDDDEGCHCPDLCPFSPFVVP